jgi:enhancing lycopene biosynthesis protein 2
MSKKIAVVLAGCGRADGSEIHESVSVLIHLSRKGWAYSCFAPDAPQAEVTNHATGKAMPGGQTRNMMVEAARISRGQIAPIDRLGTADFDALVVPGGFGAAKNLCNFASKGADCDVLPDLERIIHGFHKSQKPMAFCCIAPVIVARVLGTRSGGPGCMVTVGNDAATSEAIRTMGSSHAGRGVTEACTDLKNKVVTTPAYMYDARPHEVFDGIGKMVDDLATLLGP